LNEGFHVREQTIAVSGAKKTRSPAIALTIERYVYYTMHPR